MKLSADVTDLQLEEVFQVFGTVQSVSIRSSRGCPRTVRPGRARCRCKGHRHESDLYASVLFQQAGAVQRAMEFNGSEINGRPVIVRLSLCIFWSNITDRNKQIVRDALDLHQYKEFIRGYRKKAETTTPHPPVANAPSPAKKWAPIVSSLTSLTYLYWF